MTEHVKTIDTLTAWVVTELSGGEGIIGYRSNDGWIPLIGADAERIEGLRAVAVRLAKDLGLPLRLVRFSTREVLEEHLPEPPHDP